MRPKVIEVRDRKNPERLLGTFHRAPPEWAGRWYSVALAPSLRVLHDDEPTRPFTADIRTVRFEIGTRPSADNYDLIGVFLTDNPLDDLLDINGFTLPGESLRAADERRYWRS